MRHGLALANQGLGALADPHLRNGVKVHRVQITNRPVAKNLDAEFVDPHLLGIDA